jgi:hypothetical protein
MIPIEASPSDAAQRQQRATNKYQYWSKFYRTHDEEPKDLKEKLTLLNLNKKPVDVEAVLRGYLTHHAKNAEPWMYEALAIAIKANKGKDADVKQALGYAADLAERSRNPNHLVSAADMLFMYGYYDRVGALLDQAAEKVPHRAEPQLMSIKLAEKTKDPERMAASVDRLLSLGWPGNDEQVRRDARKAVDGLARTLREDGRGSEADTLMARLEKSEARDLFVRMTWVGDAGLSLAVEEPLGTTAQYPASPRTVFGGSIVKEGYGTHPESVYVCPRGFDGPYTIRVVTLYNNPKKPALEARLEVITHEGTPQEHRETRTLRLTPKQGPEPVVVRLSGGQRKTVLPLLSPHVLQAAKEQAKGKGQKKTKDGGAASRKPTSPQPPASAGAAGPRGR